MVDQELLNAIEAMIDKKTAALSKEITENTVAGMNTIVENLVQGQINMVLDGQDVLERKLSGLLDKQPAAEATEIRLSAVKSMVCVHSYENAAMKKAQ